MKSLILHLLVLISLSACDNKKNDVSAIEDPILKEIALLPEINSAAVKQNNFKKMEMELHLKGTGIQSKATYELDYYLDGKIKSIKSNQNEVINFDYQNTSLVIKNNHLESRFNLNEKGLVSSKQDEQRSTKYYFKDDFLVRKSDLITEIFDYSTQGNLQKYSGSQYEATYSYTNFPNTIRQEIFAPTAVHWTFRDTYLGKFSTNLIKTLVFNKGKSDEANLIFNYSFDNQNLVNQVIIDRTAPSGMDKIVYEYSY